MGLISWLALFAPVIGAGVAYTLVRVALARKRAADKKSWEGVDMTKIGFQPKAVFYWKIDPGLSTIGDEFWKVHPDSIGKGLRTAIGKPVKFGVNGPDIGKIIDVDEKGKLLAEIDEKEYERARFSEMFRRHNVDLLRALGRKDIPDDYVLKRGEGRWIRDSMVKLLETEEGRRLYETKIRRIIDKYMTANKYGCDIPHYIPPPSEPVD